MPDPKPPEPIKLKELIQALAYTVVNTSHQLDEANVDLRRSYFESGNGRLALMTPPRYVLDEVTVDISFVVAEARPDAPGTDKPQDSDVKVLVDPKTLAETPVEARQTLHLTFHGQGHEKVKIGDTEKLI